MKRKKTKREPEKPPILHHCFWEGCDKEGEFPAPKSKQQLREYIWFCLEHIRLYNQAWDYFAGMSEEAIAQYQIDAIHGHKPTWERGVNDKRSAQINQKILDEVAKLRGIPETQSSYPNPLPPKERDALAMFGLAYPVTIKEIKKRYKELVKRYHPDINNNDKQREEQFKTISQAYKMLINSGFFSDEK